MQLLLIFSKKVKELALVDVHHALNIFLNDFVDIIKYNTVSQIRHYLQFSSVQSLSRVRLFVTPWIAAHQASLSITNSWSLQFNIYSTRFLINDCHISGIVWRYRDTKRENIFAVCVGFFSVKEKRDNEDKAKILQMLWSQYIIHPFIHCGLSGTVLSAGKWHLMTVNETEKDLFPHRAGILVFILRITKDNHLES